MDIPAEYKRNIYRALLAFLVIMSVFFAIKAISEMRAYGTIGGVEAHTITLTGQGEVSAVPDIATVYFTISKEAKTVKAAQDQVAVVEKKAIDFLKQNGIAEKDIKTSNASVNPRYEYVKGSASMPCPLDYCPPEGRSVIVGYEASESITVKVRKIDQAGEIMQGLGSVGVSNINGPEFAIDNEDALKAQARKMAIEEARAKAEVLAKDLGVRLGRVAEFSESGDYPVYFGYDRALKVGAANQEMNASAELPKGENKVIVNVTVTYEIR